ncbi:MAG: DUF3108 domain-containing protein [Verrucomicrobiales bacterium]|nr:DUF3108 domain-containing protein [Verrucomicrobiales bacterium]
MKSRRWINSITPLILFLLSVPTLSAAEPPSQKKTNKIPSPTPAWIKTVNLTKAGKQAPLKPCRVRYILSWNHLINAGEVSMSMKNSKNPSSSGDPILAGEASARSSGLARLLWSYDCELQSKTNKTSLRPLSFDHSETENGESVSYQTVFKKGRVETLRKEKNPDNGKIKLKKRTFKYPHCYDLLSSILTLRSLPLKKGESLVAVVQPFDTPYLVTFTVKGREKRKYLGKLKATVKLGVQVQKINKDFSLKKYKKLKTATLWVSEDAYRLPLELRADIFIGYVSATLVEREFLKSK